MQGSYESLVLSSKFHTDINISSPADLKAVGIWLGRFSTRSIQSSTPPYEDFNQDDITFMAKIKVYTMVLLSG